MSEVMPLPEEEINPRVKPERLAWFVLASAFVVFCVICVASTYTLQYFFFQSTVPMQTILHAGRGTLSVRVGVEAEQAEISQRSITRDTMIRTDRTDALSQGTITLRDPAGDRRISSVLTLAGGTQVRFVRASRPRFGWSTSITEAEFSDFSGDMEVIIHEDIGSDVEMRIVSINNVEFRLLEGGRYSLSVTDAQARLTNHAGEAILIAPDRTARSIPVDSQGLVEVGEEPVITIQPATLVNLLENSELNTYSREEVGSNLAGRPLFWQCESGPAENPPLGITRPGIAPDGREALQLVRENAVGVPGETRCVQDLLDVHPPLGFDITEYDYLTIRATLYIEDQSLSACGTKASECPLMFTINYLNAFGAGIEQTNVWHQGLYARLDPAANYRLACDTCPRDHVLIYEGAWYTYESGNLLDFIPPGERPLNLEDMPTHITEFIFYASGHEYNVYVDSVYLLAGKLSDTDAETTPAN